jgi:hypothetical protein
MSKEQIKLFHKLAERDPPKRLGAPRGLHLWKEKREGQYRLPPLGPLRVMLVDGRTVVGELKGVRRSCAAEQSLSQGTILLVASSGEIVIDYASIGNIT